jgi:hypothetical protein
VHDEELRFEMYDVFGIVVKIICLKFNIIFNYFNMLMFKIKF